MNGMETCGQCGIPTYIASEHQWHPSGFIIQRRDARHILIFIESENLNILMREIEGILGVSIQRIVINTRRRAAKAYMDRIIPDALKEQVRGGRLDVGPAVQGLVGIGHVLGYGRFEVLGSRLQGDDRDYLLVRVHRPYSITLGCVDPVAAFEALVGREMGLTYRETGPDMYEIKAFPSPHPEEFKGRLMMKRYSYPEGDIHFESCTACGAPLILGEFAWDLDAGLIRHRETCRRMIFFAPSVLEAIFEELERELGETIPKVVIEAQKRLTRNGLYSLDQADPGQDLRARLALRGLGNLRELTLGEEGLSLYMENAAVPLMVTGLAQGLFEATYQRDSEVDWKIMEGDALQVKVTPT